MSGTATSCDCYGALSKRRQVWRVTNRDRVTRALVLMDGFDSRSIMPLTGVHAAFRDVAGAPAADSLMRHLASQGIRDARLVCRNLPGLVVHYFSDGAEWGLRLSYLSQDRPLGSGGAIAQARSWLAETTLLIDGGLATNVSLSGIGETHSRTGADVTICLAMPHAAPGGTPVVLMDRETGRVTEIHPDVSASRAEISVPDGHELLVGVGIYIIEPAAAADLDDNRVVDWLADVLPGLAGGGRVVGWLAGDDAQFNFAPRRRALSLDQRGGPIRNPAS